MASCTSSEMPLAFTLKPYNVNEKRFVKPLLKKLKGRNVCFKTVVANAQYDSAKVRKTVRSMALNPSYLTGNVQGLRTR